MIIFTGSTQSKYLFAFKIFLNLMQVRYYLFLNLKQILLLFVYKINCTSDLVRFEFHFVSDQKYNLEELAEGLKEGGLMR